MPFASIRSVRELQDGSLLVVDGLERAVYLVNRAGTRRQELGGLGTRTLDYVGPDQILPLPGDSSLLFDATLEQYLVVTPEGSEAGRFELSAEATHLRTIRPHASDQLGGIFFAEPGGLTEIGPEGKVRSVSRVFRYDRRTGQVQVMARTAGPSAPMGPPSLPGAGTSDDSGTVVLPVPNPYQPTDAWGVAEDGRVAVVHVDADRLEWFGAAGAVMTGPRLQIEGRPVASSDRERYLEAWREEQLREGFDRDYLRAVQADWVDWPAEAPGFRGGFAPVDPWGNLWLSLSHPGDIVTRFALIDGQGVRRAEVTLPLHSRLQGFGSDALYLVRTDGVGLEWIQRYPWPPRSAGGR
jgi:hypothetical protein